VNGTGAAPGPGDLSGTIADHASVVNTTSLVAVPESEPASNYTNFTLTVATSNNSDISERQVQNKNETGPAIV
jgi:hypothetical protein